MGSPDQDRVIQVTALVAAVKGLAVGRTLRRAAAADTVTEESALRRAARYVRAMLLARVYAVFRSSARGAAAHIKVFYRGGTGGQL